MRCEEVDELLPEWAEGSLVDEERVDIEEHAITCSACGALLKEAKESESQMRGLFSQAAGSMSFRSSFKKKLVRELSEGTERALDVERIPWAGFWRLAAGVAVGIMLLASLVRRWERPSKNPRGLVARAPSAGHVASRATVMYVVPEYSFRQDGNLVWDTIVYRTNVLDLTLWAQR
jgi:anti-sigma factor RsiW